jgi:hypothetical protein
MFRCHPRFAANRAQEAIKFYNHATCLALLGKRQVEVDATQLEPDRVSAVVEGYFRIPAVWIGSAPAEPTIETGISLGRQVVVQATLSCGIDLPAFFGPVIFGKWPPQDWLLKDVV